MSIKERMTRGALVALLAILAALPVRAQDPAAPSRARPTAGSAVIAGRVLDGEGGVPIAGVVVALSGQRSVSDPGASRTLTDAQGRFFFSDLVAGSYQLAATKAGWIPGAYGRRRPDGGSLPVDVTDAERRIDLTVPLWRYAVISGRVVDEAGDPMVSVDLRAFQQTFAAGRRQMTFVGRMRSDDRGMYRFSNLLPGDYLIVIPTGIASEPATFGGAIRAEGQTPRAYLQTMTAVGTAPMSFERAEVTTGGTSLLSSLLALPRGPPADAAWLTYPTTYYPSTTSFGSATTVRVEAGRERSGIDLALRPLATYRVSGTLTGPDGPAANHVVHLLAADAADLPVADVSSAVTDATGAFTFYGVPPGQFVARVVRTPWPAGGFRLGITGGTDAIRSISMVTDTRPTGPPPISTDPLFYADQAVTVGDRHVRDIVMTLRTGPRVTGRAEFEGSSQRPTPEQLQSTAVVLEFAGGQSYGAIQPGRFSSDGQFTTPSTWPGRYLIRVNAPPPGWTFKGASYQGRDVSETPVDISADLDNVVITFTDRPTRIEGTVQNAEGQLAAGAMVLLFPVDSAAWRDYGRTSLRVRAVSTSAKGAFSLSAVPDGEYVLVAIADEQTADWQHPDVLRKLAAIGERVQVRGSQSIAKTLTVRRLQ
jgi:protocatechuate 3,4-dioxygenase beta subunit